MTNDERADIWLEGGETMKVLNITHRDCLDGMTSSWLVKSVFPQAFILPALAGVPLPELPKGDWDLILVTDISFTLDEMQTLKHTGAEVVLLDHHETAFERLGETEWAAYLTRAMSGALITYNWLCDNYETDEAPLFSPGVYDVVAYISDNDTWQHKLDNSHAFAAFCYQNVDVSDPARAATDLNSLTFDWSQDHALFLTLGKQIQDVHQRGYDLSVKRAVWSSFAGYHSIPITCCPPEQSSSVGNILARQVVDTNTDLMADGDFAVCWSIERGDEGEAYARISLRSVTGSGLCLDLASSYGGGGHANACGFRMNPSEWFRMLGRETGEEWL